MFKKNWPDFLVIFLILLYFIVFSYFSILRHHNYYSYRYDLGNMEQTIWNTTRGNTFIFTDPEGFGNISRLKYHADFFLIMLAPIYKLFPYTETLLILQTLALAFGGLPIYWLSKEVLKKKPLAVLPVIFYLLYPALQRSNYFDFHAVKFVTTFLLFAFWYLYKRKYLRFILFSFLAISCKEQIPLIIILLSLYGVLRDKKFRITGLILAILCLVYFLFIFFKAIPQFQENNRHFVFKHFTTSDLSEKNLKLSLNLGFLFDSSFWLMCIQLLLPLFFIPLLSPGYLFFSFPDFFPKILSNNVYYRSIDFQYTNPITPFIFIAFIFGFSRYLNLFSKWKISFEKGLLLLVVFSIICLYFWSPFSGNFSGVEAKKIITGRPEKKFIDQFKKMVPDDKSVCATNNLGSHFAKRWFLYSFPNNALEADYTLILKGDGNMIDMKITEDIINSLKKNNRYVKLAEYKDFIAYKKIRYSK